MTNLIDDARLEELRKVVEAAQPSPRDWGSEQEKHMILEGDANALHLFRKAFTPEIAATLLDTIAAQRAEIERLEGAIRHVAEQGLIDKQDAEDLGTDESWDWHRGYSAAIANCRTALSQSEGEE